MEKFRSRQQEEGCFNNISCATLNVETGLNIIDDSAMQIIIVAVQFLLRTKSYLIRLRSTELEKVKSYVKLKERKTNVLVSQ